MGAKNKPFICVTSCFENAGFRPTKGNEWNGFWGKGIVEGLKKMNKY